MFTWITADFLFPSSLPPPAPSAPPTYWEISFLSQFAEWSCSHDNQIKMRLLMTRMLLLRFPPPTFSSQVQTGEKVETLSPTITNTTLLRAEAPWRRSIPVRCRSRGRSWVSCVGGVMCVCVCMGGGGVCGMARWSSLSGVTLHHPPVLPLGGSCVGSASFTGTAGGEGG